MSRPLRPSARQPHPHRMPPRTYWKAAEPGDDVVGHSWVERTVPQAAVEPVDEPPEVTASAWVDWVEQKMQHEDAEAPGDDVRIAIVVAIATALVAALAAGMWWWSGRDDGDSTYQARPVAADRNTDQAPRSPVVLPPDGEHTEVRVLGSGDLAVEQWIRSSRGLTSMDLSLPVVGLTTVGVQANDMVVVAGSQRVETPTRILSPLRLIFPPTETIYLSYRLSGALERETSGTRALARVTSLTVSYDRTAGPETIAFRGATMLNLACTPVIGDADAVPCGADAGPKGWRVVPPEAAGGDVHVMAQLDLEHPG